MGWNTVFAIVTVFVAVLLTGVTSQVYNIFSFTTSDSNILSSSYGLPLKEKEFMFEIKTCDGTGYIEMNNYSGKWMFFLLFWKKATGVYKLDYEIRKGKRFSISVPSLLCGGNFKKLKIGWRQDVFSIWQFKPIGWELLLSWNDVTPYLQNVTDIRFRGKGNIDWKLYVLEHTGKPYRVSCSKP